MKVKEFMITKVYTRRKTDTIKSVLQTFVEHKIGGVPIVDEENHLVGIISDGDILRYLNHKEVIIYEMFMYGAFSVPQEEYNRGFKDKVNEIIEDVMKNKHVYTVKEDDEMEKALELLSKHHFKKIPVVNEQGKVVGIISRGDVLRQIHSHLLEL